jgi:hypothetical protein
MLNPLLAENISQMRSCFCREITLLQVHFIVYNMNFSMLDIHTKSVVLDIL